MPWLTYVFGRSGLKTALNFPSAIQEMMHVGLRPATWLAAASNALQLAAPLTIVVCSRWG